MRARHGVLSSSIHPEGGTPCLLTACWKLPGLNPRAAVGRCSARWACRSSPPEFCCSYRSSGLRRCRLCNGSAHRSRWRLRPVRRRAAGSGLAGQLAGLDAGGRLELAVEVVRAQAAAVLVGRDYVTPDDVKQLFIPVCGHRVVSKTYLSNGDANATGRVLQNILDQVPTPR